MKERRQSSSLFDLVAAQFDGDGVQATSAIKSDGKEYPDSVPMSPPVGYEPPSQLEDLIENLIRRREFNKAAEAAGFDSFEEDDDFEVEDEDYDPRFPETLYEAYFDAKAKRRAAWEAARQAATAQPPVVSSGSGLKDSPAGNPTVGASAPKLPSVDRLAAERREPSDE